MKKNILIVEDDILELDVLAKKFQREQFNVSVAHDGMEGLEKALKEKPDMVLLDIVMPRMDGFTMLQKLRADTWGQTVPVIVLTNLGDAATSLRALSDTAIVGLLIKSDWSLEDLVAKVRVKLGEI